MEYEIFQYLGICMYASKKHWQILVHINVYEVVLSSIGMGLGVVVVTILFI